MVDAVGSDRAIEMLEAFVWPLSDALEAVVAIELILLLGESGSKALLACQDSSGNVTV